MKVFISSVRQGLEAERDALPGLLRAVGHTPLRFEDFTAQPAPSREACLDGVAAADAVVVLMGPRYGTRFPETGQSPSEDEWAEATRLGKPRLVFVKDGITFDSDQEEFLEKIGSYRDGVFYHRFSDTAELQIQVAAAVRSLEGRPKPLRYRALGPATPAVEWLPEDDRRLSATDKPWLEVHVLPIPEQPLSARQLSDLEGSLPGAMRQFAQVPHSAPMMVLSELGSLIVGVGRPTSAWNELSLGSIAGTRVTANGHITVWANLPRDGMGAVLDPQVLPEQIAEMLRFVGGANLISSDEVAIAIALSSRHMVSVGSIARMPRSSSSMSLDQQPLRIAPDEAMTVAALGTSADEVAAPLARTLVARFERR